MEWTKIKVKHFLHSELPKTALADLVRILCLTASLEKMPTEKQMLKFSTKMNLKLIQNQLKMDEVSLEFVLNKVLEDCDKLKKRKNVSAEASRRYRERHSNSDTSRHVSRDTSRHPCREEKRREENKKHNSHFPLEADFNHLWSRYPPKAKVGKDDAKKSFKGSVKSDKDLININKAFDNYLKSETVKKGFVKNGRKWFREWKDWIEYSEEQPEIARPNTNPL